VLQTINDCNKGRCVCLTVYMLHPRTTRQLNVRPSRQKVVLLCMA